MKALSSPTMTTISATRAILHGLLLCLTLLTLTACGVGPSRDPLPQAPATAPSSTPEAKAANDTAKAIDAPLADAQAQAQALPPTLPQRGALLDDLRKIAGYVERLQTLLPSLVTKAQAQDDAAKAEAKWRQTVTDQYNGLAKDNERLRDEQNSKFQRLILWLTLGAIVLGVGGAAFLIVYWHNLPGGLTTLAVTVGVVMFLRFLGIIDLYKWQILGTVAAFCLAYELAWTIYYKRKGMSWGQAIAAALKTWNTVQPAPTTSGAVLAPARSATDGAAQANGGGV